MQCVWAAWIPKNVIFVNEASFEALDPEKTAGYMEQLKSNGMAVGAPGDALKSDLTEIGARLTEDWLAKAGSEGAAVLDAYKKM